MKHSSATQSYAWVILGVVCIASIAAPLNQMKVPPIMPVLISTFNLSLSSSGLLMSVFAITGLILALPAGLIVQRLGLKTTGMIALGALVAGSIIGAVATSYGVLLFGRVIEGTGMGLIAVVAPATIAAWFPPEKQGAPMGIWATWVPVGSLVMFLLAPAMTASLGWQSIWWFGAGFALLALILYAVLMRTPAIQPAAPDGSGKAPTGTGSLKLALANPNIWLLGLAFAAFNLGMGGTGTYYPTFLSSMREFSMSAASSTTSLMTLVVLFAGPLAGLLSDRIGSRRLVFTTPFLFLAVMMLFPFTISGGWIPAWLIGMGLVLGAIPTAIFSATPEVMGSPHLAGLGMSVIMLGQNLGMFIAPILFGALVESSGWAIAGYAMIPICLGGFIAGWFVKVR
jgi:predicted MFS family arabinose efflux permease